MGATDDPLGVVGMNLVCDSMSNAPGKADHWSIDKGGFSATNLSVTLGVFNWGDACKVPEEKA